jgi:ABC-type transport system substrate-binding protein
LGLLTTVKPPALRERHDWTYLCDTALDNLFRQQASTMDQTTRLALFRRINRIIAEHVYWVSLWDDPDVYAINKRLHNMRLSGVAPFWNCYTWEITP